MDDKGNRERLRDIYGKMGIGVETGYFEGDFTLKYRTCPYYKPVKKGQNAWLNL